MSEAKVTGEGRICSLCDVFKSWDHFDKKSTGFNGRHCQCKSCIKVKKKKWWRRKNQKARTSPNVLIHGCSDIEIIEVPTTGQNKRDLENIFRQLVFEAVIDRKDKKS